MEDGIETGRRWGGLATVLPAPSATSSGTELPQFVDAAFEATFAALAIAAGELGHLLQGCCMALRKSNSPCALSFCVMSCCSFALRAPAICWFRSLICACSSLMRAFTSLCILARYWLRGWFPAPLAGVAAGSSAASAWADLKASCATSAAMFCALN